MELSQLYYNCIRTCQCEDLYRYQRKFVVLSTAEINRVFLSDCSLLVLAEPSSSCNANTFKSKCSSINNFIPIVFELLQVMMQ